MFGRGTVDEQVRAARETLYGLVLPDGQRWGEVAAPVQRADAEAVLDLGASQRRHWIGRPKGWSKTTDLAGVSIAVLLDQLPPGSAGYVAAADADQAGLLRRSAAEFVSNTVGLADNLEVESKRLVARRRGTELIVLAADTAGSHGLRPAFLAVDELANWPDQEGHRQLFDSVWAGLAKMRGSRGVVITTAGSPGHFARKVYDTAVADQRRWRVSDIHVRPPWVAVEDYEAERARLLPSTFARLWRNEWVQGEDRLARPDDVDACMLLDGWQPPEQGRQYVATLDLAVKKDRAVLAVSHRERDPLRLVVDVLKVWEPRPGHPVSLDEVRATTEQVCRSYRARLHYDPFQAALMAEQLRRAGIGCSEYVFSARSVGAVAAALLNALQAHRILLPRDDRLRDELLNVRLIETSVGGVRLDHDAAHHDDQAVVLGMACHLLLTAADSSGHLIAWREMAAESVSDWRSRMVGRLQAEIAASRPAAEVCPADPDGAHFWGVGEVGSRCCVYCGARMGLVS